MVPLIPRYNISQLCPIPEGPFTAIGNITVPQNYASQIPSIAFTLPDVCSQRYSGLMLVTRRSDLGNNHRRRGGCCLSLRHYRQRQHCRTNLCYRSRRRDCRISFTPFGRKCTWTPRWLPRSTLCRCHALVQLYRLFRYVQRQLSSHLSQFLEEFWMVDWFGYLARHARQYRQLPSKNRRKSDG